MEKFLSQRLNEILCERYSQRDGVEDGVRELFIRAGYKFIEKRMYENFDAVTPEFTRKLELLETLLFSLIDHGDDFKLLEKFGQEMDGQH